MTRPAMILFVERVGAALKPKSFVAPSHRMLAAQLLEPQPAIAGTIQIGGDRVSPRPSRTAPTGHSTTGRVIVAAMFAGCSLAGLTGLTSTQYACADPIRSRA